MKKILLGLLLLTCFSSNAKERELAIEPGTYTVSAVLGFPNYRKIYKSFNPYASYGPISGFGADGIFTAGILYKFTGRE